MSHISTAPRAARGGFDALPRPSHSSDSDGDEFGARARQYRDLSEECEERFRSVSPDSDYEGRGYDVQPHNIHHDAAPGSRQPDRGSVDASRTSSYSDVTKFHAQGAAHRGFYSPAAEKHRTGSPPDQRRPNYKPSALRWPFLTILLIALLGLLAMVVYALRQLPYRDAQLQILGKRDVPQLALGKRVVAASDFPSEDEPWSTGPILAPRDDEPEGGSKGEETAPGAGATSKDSETPAGSVTNSPGPTAGGPTGTKAAGGDATTAPPAVTTSPGSNGGDGGATATSSPKHGDPKMKDPSDHGQVDTPMTRTESPDDITDLPDDSNDGPTSFTVAPSKATDDYGNVGSTRTITQDPGKTTVSPEEPGTLTPPPVVSTADYTIPPSNHGQVGETVTQDDDVTSTKATTDFGHVDETVTHGEPHATQPPSHFGPVGTTISSVTQSPSDFGPVDKTVTGDGSTGIATVNPSDYGPVETVVVVPGKDKEQEGDDDDDKKPAKTQPLPPAYVTAAPTTLTNSKGEATATSTATPAPMSTPKTVVYADSKGQPTSTQITNVEAKPSTLIETNAEGVQTTVVRYPSSVPVSTSSETSTLTDDEGKPTKTELRKFLVTPSVTVETNSDGVPTATETSYHAVPSEYAGDSNTVETLSYISWGDYFVGMFLPTLLAMILGWPIRILDQNARSFQPFHELTRPGGVTGARSVCLETGGWGGIYSTARWVFKGQVTVIASTVLILASALLVPLSAEAISLDLRGDCVRGSGNAQGCQYVLSTRSQAIHATISLLAVMALAVLVLMAYAARWQTGVRTNPWSICGIAALSLNDEVRKLFTSLPAGIDASKIPLKLLGSVLGHRRFTLGYYYNATGTLEYGFMLQEGAAEANSEERAPEMRPSQTTRSEGDSLLGQQRDHEGAHMQTKHNLPFLMLGYLGRGTLLAVIVGLLVLILYYNNTGGESAFEDFMSSESFGLRFLFTGVGIIITYFWASFFNSIAVMSPYLLLSQTPHVARRSILLSPPTNAFSGLWSAIRRRHAFLAVVAVTSILSEFLPIFLAEVPFRVSQAYIVHQVCTWSATGILFVMLAVVLGSFFVTWPHMPLDPSTIAGAMYYVCDSALLGHLEGGASLLGREERDQRVNAMGLRYRFGEMRGASNCKKRIGVDVSDDRLQSA